MTLIAMTLLRIAIPVKDYVLVMCSFQFILETVQAYPVWSTPLFHRIGCHIDGSLEDQDNDYSEPAEGYSESVNGKETWTYEELRKIGWHRFIGKCKGVIRYLIPCGNPVCPIRKYSMYQNHSLISLFVI